MHAIANLLDRARKHSGIGSDSALAERLGRSRQALSHWRVGYKVPEDDQVMALARLAGEDQGPWLLLAQAARTTGAAHEAWVALARRLGAAASITLMLFAVSLPSPARSRSALSIAEPEQAHALHIMRN